MRTRVTLPGSCCPSTLVSWQGPSQRDGTASLRLADPQRTSQGETRLTQVHMYNTQRNLKSRSMWILVANCYTLYVTMMAVGAHLLLQVHNERTAKAPTSTTLSACENAYTKASSDCITYLLESLTSCQPFFPVSVSKLVHQPTRQHLCSFLIYVLRLVEGGGCWRSRRGGEKGKRRKKECGYETLILLANIAILQN